MSESAISTTRVTVSVVVPCYNQEDTISRCLTSLINQTYPAEDFEIFLADNGSSDRSVEIARQFDRVRLIQEFQRGSYSARNTAVRETSGSILAFTDGDCEANTNWLQSIVNAFEDPQVLMILGANRFADESFFLRTRADYENEKVRYICAQKNPQYYYAYTNNLAVRRSAFDVCGPFETILRGADSVFGSRIIAKYGCDAVRFVPEMQVRHWEIISSSTWFSKLWTYGRSYGDYCRTTGTRPITFRQRMRVRFGMMSQPDSTLARAAWLFFSDLIGTAAYLLGRVSRKIY
ncbi:MAG: glycosyltransferase [Schlesneria sp.]